MHFDVLHYDNGIDIYGRIAIYFDELLLLVSARSWPFVTDMYNAFRLLLVITARGPLA